MDVRRGAEMYRVAILVESENGTSFPDAVSRPEKPGQKLNMKLEETAFLISHAGPSVEQHDSMRRTKGQLRHGLGLGPLGILNRHMR
jgi:hypothetical protein